ncbi:MAG: sulfatase-like hydrolase/transferase [Kofleriaceae bacterium]|nr:sulfatase-like hydrolase/transferase [Kofleriaceae bacterium]
MAHSDSSSAAPYKDGLRTGLGVALGASTLLAFFDIVRSMMSGASAGGALPLLGMWSMLGLFVGLGLAVVLGAGNATWGTGFVRRGLAALRDNTDADRNATAVLLAAVMMIPPLVLAVAKLSVDLVGNRERKDVGGLLLGVIVVVALVVLAIAALPMYRMMRRMVVVVPRLGGVPRLVVVLLGGGLAVLAATLFFVFTKLDWRILNLGSLLAPAALPLLALVLGAIASGPARGLIQRLPAGPLPAVIAAAVATMLVGLVLLRTPAASTIADITDKTLIGTKAVTLLRKLIDRDHDGYSAFWGGPDCDDHNAAVHPNAKELPGNGIDDNCVGGDGQILDGDKTQPVVPMQPGQAAADAAPAPTPPPAATALPGVQNVLIVFVDTLRYDRLGSSGYQRDGKSLTPNLDAFAAQAVSFSHAYAQAPNTPRSVPSFLTSRYPSQVKVDKQFAGYPANADDNDFLFEQLKAGGLFTVGETSHFYFCDDKRDPAMCQGFGHKRHTNVMQGADDWQNLEAVDIGPSNKDIASPRIVPRAIAKLNELAQSKKRFAMMVHLFEPHSTYVEHDGYKITESGTAALAQKYDYEITFMDTWLGKLFDSLKSNGLADNTLVVVIADHGEAFGVHSVAGNRMFFHGQTLYDELLHVPMMFRAPGLAASKRDDVVQLVDLAPTIAAAMGAPASSKWVGRSLVPALTGATLPPAPAFAELLPAPDWNHDGKAMISADGKYKVFYRISDSRWEIYDLVTDPAETKNLADDAAIAAPLKQQLVTWMEGPLGNAP